MLYKRRGLRMGIGLLLAAFVLSAGPIGCSSREAGPQHQTRDVDGMLVDMSAHPGLPQDTGATNSTAESSGAVAGDNTLVITLRDDKSGNPITDANVAAYASNSLTGQQRAESGRHQGNGVYLTPIRFGVPDTYDVTVTVDRSRHQESSMHFSITAG